MKDVCAAHEARGGEVVVICGAWAFSSTWICILECWVRQ